jgi:hypothetical protein
MKMEKIEIRSWIDSALLFKLTPKLAKYFKIDFTLKCAVELAIKLEVKLNGAKLNWAELNEAELNGAELNGAELNWAKLNWAELNGAKLNGAKLNGAKLNGAELNGAELNWAKLNGAKLNGAELNKAELNGAKLNGAELNGAKLVNGEEYIPITQKEAHKHHKAMWKMLIDPKKKKIDYPELIEAKKKWPNLPSNCFLCLFYKTCDKCPLGQVNQECDVDGSWWKIYNGTDEKVKIEAAKNIAEIVK